MPAYIVEIETPTGRRLRKGTIAADEKTAVDGIRHLQTCYDKLGRPKCQLGEIVDVWVREAGRPIPKGVLSSPQATYLVSQFRLA